MKSWLENFIGLEIMINKVATNENILATRCQAHV